MPKTMDQRTPLTAYWIAIKSKNPDLTKNPAFKPDINGPIKTYDAGMLQYVKLKQDQEKLLDAFNPYEKLMGDIGEKLYNHNAELAKITDTNMADVQKGGGLLSALSKKEDADPAEITGILTDRAAKDANFAGSRGQVWDRITKLWESRIAATKKIRDDYKAKATTLAAGIKKIEDDTVKLEAQIRSIISAYQKVAVNLDKDEIADAVRELLGRF